MAGASRGPRPERRLLATPRTAVFLIDADLAATGLLAACRVVAFAAAGRRPVGAWFDGSAEVWTMGGTAPEEIVAALAGAPRETGDDGGERPDMGETK